MRPWIGPLSRRIGALLLLALVPSRLAASPPPAADEAQVERRLAAMGTELALVLMGGERGSLLAASEAALAALAATEARLSTWRAEGELARLNRQPVGEPFPLSAALAAELETAWACREVTAGAFEPALGALVAAWGLREGGRIPAAAALRAAREASGPETFRLGPGPFATRLHPEARIEEGGFGKGAGLDHAAAALAGSGVRARLDLGGQVLLAGEPRPERLLVADPRQRERPAVEVRIGHGSLATSGNSERGMSVAGERVGHLLDPRTGEPASDPGSVTVWAPTAFLADCLSTGLFVLGAEAALAFPERHPEVGVLLLEPVTGGLRARVAGALAGRVRAVAPEVHIEERPPVAGSLAPQGDPH